MSKKLTKVSKSKDKAKVTNETLEHTEVNVRCQSVSPFSNRRTDKEHDMNKKRNKKERIPFMLERLPKQRRRQVPPSETSPIRRNLLLLLDAIVNGQKDVVDDLIHNKGMTINSSVTDDEGYTVLDWSLMLGLVEYADSGQSGTYR